MALQEQWQRFFQPTLQEHPGTLEKRSRGVPQRKTLFSRDRNLFLGSRSEPRPPAGKTGTASRCGAEQ